jgi:hypothetical protein
MDSLTRILRRLSSRALNDTERKDDAEQLVGMLGVTPNVAAELGAEGSSLSSNCAMSIGSFVRLHSQSGFSIASLEFYRCDCGRVSAPRSR